MSFTGSKGYFGPLASFNGHYHPSVYAKYSRGGGSENATGTLGKSFAYKRPKLAQGGNVVAGKMSEQNNPYKQPPRNGPNNDYHQGHTRGRDGMSYTWGKVSPRFQNDGAEITPQGHNEVTGRKLARGGKAQMTHTQAGNGLHIHSGEGLILNIHLSNVGADAISLQHSGAVQRPVHVQRPALRVPSFPVFPVRRPIQPAVVSESCSVR